MEKEYKQNQKLIKHLCFRYSKYFKIDFYDLLSFCNEMFIKIYNKYTYNKLPFKKYLYIQLNNYLKMHCKKELQKREREHLIKIKNGVYFYTYIEYKQKKELQGLSKIILDFCIDPDNYEMLKQYNKNKYYKYKRNTNKVSFFKIRDYFHKYFGISLHKLNNVFEEIKLYLKEELI